MKTILCYGDSNTWGYIPGAGERFGREIRWCGVMREKLGEGYVVIEEGLNGRTTAHDDPQEAYRNGCDYLPPCLETHSPIDLVIIMLGSNDIKARFGFQAEDIAGGMEKLLGIIKGSEAGLEGKAPRILLLSPPHVSPQTELIDFIGRYEVSKRLGALYEQLASQYGCSFLDVSTVVGVSDLPDGLHLNEKAHAALGSALAGIVKEILG